MTGTQANVLREGRPDPRQSLPRMKKPSQEAVIDSPRTVAAGALAQVEADPESL